MDDRARILAALGGASGTGLPRPDFRSESPALTWEDFGIRLQSLGGRLASLDDLAVFSGARAVADADAMPFLGGLSLEWVEDLWEAEVGFTTADLAVAESGSLLISAGPGRRRLASLAPPVHVAFVPKNALVSTLEEGLDRLSGRTSVLITGSSRTADIEGVLVRGVHGPKEVWVVPA